ncbi:bZIP transcription factor 17 [Sesamum alatum]|uniref:BZIP transcription factor 17 n=1 Tax=Sesamum alatum TaxID=300844 RepID=A0AAE1YL49_9LAMI|nr:bZIP transcription factor 17 [Sesamum alatum]
MAEATVVAVDLPPPPPETTECDSGLSIPPLDTAFFSQQLVDDDGDNQHDVVIDDLDFDFDIDDLWLPSSDDLDDLLNTDPLQDFDAEPGSDSNFSQFEPNLDQLYGFFKSTSSELRHIYGDGDFLGDRSPNGSGILNSASPGLESNQISGYLNVQSPESNGSNRGIPENCGGNADVLDCPSPESQSSGNCGSNVSENSNNNVNRSVSSPGNSNNSSSRTGVVDQKIKLEEPSKNKVNSSLLKRKKDCGDLLNNTVESRINKCRKSNFNSENNDNTDAKAGSSEEEEKKKARLMRNRESAQLSRQRKKHYVQELEDKVKMMNSTIQDLNAKISYFMAENATLRQQMCGGAVPPPPMVPPPGMYPHPAMMYPWMPGAPPYMVKPQGSQVPLVPIPRLKPQQPAQAPKGPKKAESKKKEGPKTKKVAGVSFLGLLFFIMLFGGLVPLVNMRYGGVRESLMGGESYVGSGYYEKHHGRILMLNGTEYGEKYGDIRDYNCKRDHDSGGKPSSYEFVQVGNVSEPLVASLYVPRNDKLVKIDGNLIIHSVLASEKAMSSHGERGGETGLAIPGDLSPIPVPGMGRNGARYSHLRALAAGSTDKENKNSKATDGRLQQWFREGLAGPMLSSGMCTEVFQFDVSPVSASGAIVPATTSRNISKEQNQNSTHLSKGRNRRILHSLPIPLPESSHNISRQHTGQNSQKENLNRNNSTLPMVVSVLVDPREAADVDVDGVMGTKSHSRIFVVVLVDSVKYVTYSCMLPFKGSAPHLVTA